MNNKIKNIKKYILISILVVLAVASVMMTIETSTSGVEIARLEEKERQLLSERRDLEESLVKTLSVSELQVKSGDLGFTKASNLVYITQTEPVAKLP